MKYGARGRDRVENKRHTLFCNGTISLKAAVASMVRALES